MSHENKDDCNCPMCALRRVLEKAHPERDRLKGWKKFLTESQRARVEEILNTADQLGTEVLLPQICASVMMEELVDRIETTEKMNKLGKLLGTKPVEDEQITTIRAQLHLLIDAI